MKKKVKIIGFPMDLGAGRRGVDMGPSALRIAHLSEKLQYLGYEVEDHGDIDIEIMETQTVKNDKLKYIDEIERTSLKLAEVVERHSRMMSSRFVSVATTQWRSAPWPELPPTAENMISVWASSGSTRMLR
ncbi:MAG: hypothetical protein HBSAPP04_07940 [Ignavibacteriaceae bacterium]|nr:MAG: hypothetical protein HBSAPP04_07940 [Ignavibacteriaceae bacterium]